MKSSIKPFGCALCRKGFVTSKSLADHIKRFHEDPKNLPKFDTAKTEKQKKGANRSTSNKSRKSKAGGTEGAGGAGTSPQIKRCRSKTFSLERPSIIKCNSNFKDPPPTLKSAMIAEDKSILAKGLTEIKVSSPRTLRPNADVKKSTEQFKEPVKQAKIKTKTKAKTKAKIKAKKKAEDSAEEKAKREVLADSSDEEPQVKQEDFALFDETRNSSRDG